MITYFHRCSLCDATDNENVVNDISRYTNQSFFPDPDDPMFFVCTECHESIREYASDFDDDDESGIELHEDE